MTTPNGDTTHLLYRLRKNNAGARNDLIGHAYERLRLLTRRMLRAYLAVRRWEQTEDVHHNALMRLRRALEGCRPESSRHFWRLGALAIRRELIDLARHHGGPGGHGAMHHTDPGGRAADDPGGPLYRLAADTEEPSSPAEWAEFYQRVGSLPAEEREVFDHLWVRGLTQGQTAEELGVSLRTVKRRWQSARLLLARAR